MNGSTGNPFATLANLTAFWKAPDNADRANFLLTLASNLLRQMGTRSGVDVDAQTAASGAYASTIQWVVMEAVKRALLTPTDAAPANSIQQTAGPYSENIVFTNPSGDLWFKKSELANLGIANIQTLSTITTTPNADIYTPFDDSLGNYYQ